MSNRLLLHTCCAPCLTQSAAVTLGWDFHEKAIESRAGWSVSVFFYNPNLFPRQEIPRRENEVKRVVLSYKARGGDISLHSADYNMEAETEGWMKAIRGLEDEPEKGRRCFACYAYRLEKAFSEAAKTGHDAVATTLTLSPLKDAKAVNAIGKSLERDTGIKYIQTDFKKNEGFKKSVLLSEQMGLYRQNYCGCAFSIKDREPGS